MTAPDEPRSPASEIAQLVRAMESAWNRRDMDSIVFAHRIDCQWRDRTEFLWGREQIRAFLVRRWRRDVEFRILMEPWAAEGTHVAIRLACEFRNDSGLWFRAYGNESWELDGGLIGRHLSCINEHNIDAHERVLKWPAGERPADHPSLADLGL